MPRGSGITSNESSGKFLRRRFADQLDRLQKNSSVCPVDSEIDQQGRKERQPDIESQGRVVENRFAELEGVGTDVVVQETQGCKDLPADFRGVGLVNLVDFLRSLGRRYD